MNQIDIGSTDLYCLKFKIKNDSKDDRIKIIANEALGVFTILKNFKIYSVEVMTQKALSFFS